MRDDDANASDASEASSIGEIEMLWTKLKEKRTQLIKMKDQMSDRRKKLRDLRRRKDDADNAFMSVIRPMLVSQRGPLHTPANLLERRFTDMQSLRTEYHFQEASYEGLEVMLDEEEAALNKLETRFFSLLGAGRTRPERPRPDTDSETEQMDYFRNMPLDLKGISPHGPPEDRHPLYVELLSTVGDLGNAKEEYDDLLFIMDQYDYEPAVNAANGKPPDEEEIEFRAEYPYRKQQLMDTIAELQEAMARLRQLCEEKGVLSKHRSARVEYLLYPEREYEDMELDDIDVIRANHKSLAHSRFNVLLTQPEHVLAESLPYTPYTALKAAAALPNDDSEKRSKMQLAAKEYAIDRLVVEHGDDRKADSVNRWLLQQLRTSPLNAVLLHRTFVDRGSLKIRDFWRWQSDVLHYWWHDDAGSFDEGFLKPVTSQSSRYASGAGTLPLARAASDGFDIHGAPHQHFTHNSEARTAVA